jgi:hypothetical protein
MESFGHVLMLLRHFPCLCFYVRTECPPPSAAWWKVTGIFGLQASHSGILFDRCMECFCIVYKQTCWCSCNALDQRGPNFVWRGGGQRRFAGSTCKNNIKRYTQPLKLLCNFYIYVIYKYGRGPRRDADYPDGGFSWQVLELYHDWAKTASPKPLPVYRLSVAVFYVTAQICK